MLKLLYVFPLLLLIIGCSKSDDDKKIQHIPSYMNSVYSENQKCASEEFIKLNIDGNLVEQNYTNSSLVNCRFGTPATATNGCQYCKFHRANLNIAQDPRPNFESIPLKMGIEWNLPGRDTIVKINTIHFNGIDIIFVVPQKFRENLKLGTYKAIDNPAGIGATIKLHWSVGHKNEDFEHYGGYDLKLDTDSPYEISINCIEDLGAENLNISGTFDGSFIGTEFMDHGGEIIYRTSMKGEFSYKMEF